MTAKRFNIEFDGHQYFLVIDNVNERCLARLDTRFDALAWLETYKMLSEENEQLRTKNNAYIQDIEVFKEENTHLKLENEQLQVRNDRQAKQLDRLYHLVEEKDWRTLTDILDDFKRCEEQLQREWRTYE